jgi:hypothetical protein
MYFISELAHDVLVGYSPAKPSTMKIFRILAALALFVSTGLPLHATPVYRHAWVPTAPGQLDVATPLCSVRRALVYDLLAPTDRGAGAQIDAIYDLQFTGFPAEREGALPAIPSFTYNLSDALPLSGGGLMWDGAKITFMQGIILAKPSVAGSSRISDKEVQTVFPLPYSLNEVSRDGEWLFRGKFDRISVPESRINGVILMLLGIAPAIFHLTGRCRKGLPIAGAKQSVGCRFQLGSIGERVRLEHSPSCGGVRNMLCLAQSGAPPYYPK